MGTHFTSLNPFKNTKEKKDFSGQCVADEADDALLVGEEAKPVRVIHLPDPELTDDAMASLRRIKLQNRFRKSNMKNPPPALQFPRGEPSEGYMKKVRELEVFKSLYHDLTVPKTLWDNQELGKWVASQKVRHALRWMTVEECDVLSNIGFVWNRTIVNLSS